MSARAMCVLNIALPYGFLASDGEISTVKMRGRARGIETRASGSDTELENLYINPTIKYM
jgi:hypothetical protein